MQADDSDQNRTRCVLVCHNGNVSLIARPSNLLKKSTARQGFGGAVAINTTSVSVPVFSMPCSHQGGR